MAQQLHHEHIVRINDPANVGGAWLTREQLWQGLRHTVFAPQVLDRSIDWASVEQVDPLKLRRQIRRGNSSCADEVELVPQQFLCIHADAGGMFAGSTLTIRIEEPAPQMLFVRFTYRVCGLDKVRDELEDNARRSAYRNSDIERIRQARCYVAACGGVMQ